MITVETAALAAAMKHAANVVESRNTIPILFNVRLIADGDTLELTSTNLDIEFRQRLPLVDGGALSITVDARRLSAIAGAFDKGSQTRLEMDEKRLVVKSGRSRFLLPTLPVDDFPVMPYDASTPALEIDGTVLAKAIARVEHAISTEETRYYLNGVFFNAENDKLRFAATDGKRAMVLDLDAAWPKAAPEVIVPAKLARTLRGLVDEAGPVTLQWDIRKFRCEIGNITVTGKTIDGTFPDYRRILPKPGDAPMDVDPEALRAALRRVDLIASGIKDRCMIFETGEDVLNITARANEGDEVGEQVPATCQPGTRIGFNTAFLAATLEAIGGDTVEIHTTGPKDPVLFRRKVGGDGCGLLMPVGI